MSAIEIDGVAGSEDDEKSGLSVDLEDVEDPEVEFSNPLAAMAILRANNVDGGS